MIRYQPVLILFVLFALVFGGNGCAMRQEVWDVEDRVKALETENTRLRQALSAIGDEADQSGDLQEELRAFAATQQAEFYDMRTEMRRLSGMVEEVEYRIDRDVGMLRDEMAELNLGIRNNARTIEEYEQRLERMETYLGMEAERREPDPSSDTEQAASKTFSEMDEEALYSAAKGLFDDGEFDRAIDGFEVFLERFPESRLADNARFWTGEVYFAEEWYERAIVEYQKVIDDYPEGSKVPGAYLKQGIAFHLLGENDNALYVLRELVDRFPDHNEAQVARSRIGRIEQ